MLTLKVIGITFAVLLIAPPLAYMLVKWGATGYFNAKRRDETKHKSNEKRQGT